MKLTNYDKIHFDVLLPLISKRRIGVQNLSNINSIKDLVVNYQKVKKLAKRSRGKLSIIIEYADGKNILTTLNKLKKLI
jgi:succinate dehydrogenase/fumarate reductase-like Fe-S protein